LAADEDARRREYILNIILIISILTLIVLGSTLIWNYTVLPNYDGMNPFMFLCIALFYGSMLFMSKRGYFRIATFILAGSNMLGTLYVGWQWGASLPETLLLTVLTIVTAGVLIGSTAGFITAGLMISGLTILGIHESIYLNVPDWRYDEITTTDVITYSAMFLFISFIAWLSNKEIDRSLARARRSERALGIERDSLEQKVAERTQELILNQEKLYSENEHSIRIGELSRGVIHDMLNPLSAISLCVEQLENNDQPRNVRDSLIERATEATIRMKEFMESVRRHIDPKPSDVSIPTDIAEELEIVRDILGHKARLEHVSLIFKIEGSPTLPLCPLLIHRVLLNLISNGIDACRHLTDKDVAKVVTVSFKREPDIAIISVSDNGCGMDKRRVRSLFDKPYTTKVDGTGLGLITVHSIITKDFGGTIHASSEVGKGTEFVIVIPLKQHERSHIADQTKSLSETPGH
jgi:signal transduction histidine kinase